MSTVRTTVVVGCLLAVGACEFDVSPSVPGDIVLQPDTADVEVGEVTEHYVAVLDQRGDAMPAEWLSRVEWMVDPERAEIEVDGDRLLVTPKVKGRLPLAGELGNVRSRFEFWVHPPGLARIELDPPEPLVVGARYRRLAFPVLIHEDGYEMARADFRLSYVVADTTLATVIDQHTRILIWGNAFGTSSDGVEPTAGQTTLHVFASGGVSQGFDLHVTLEPTPIEEPPTVEVVSPSELRVSWTSVSDALGGYDLESAPDSAGPWTHLTTTGSNAAVPYNDTTYVDEGLAPGSTRFYRVRGCNIQGCALEYSPVGKGTTPDSPTPVAAHSRVTKPSNPASPRRHWTHRTTRSRPSTALAGIPEPRRVHRRPGELIVSRLSGV